MLPDVVLWEMSYKSQSRRLTSCIDRINVLFWKCSGSVGGVGWVPNDRRVASSNTGSNCPHVESYAVPMALSRHHLWRCQLICLQWMPWVWRSKCKSCVRKGILCKRHWQTKHANRFALVTPAGPSQKDLLLLLWLSDAIVNLSLVFALWKRVHLI